MKNRRHKIFRGKRGNERQREREREREGERGGGKKKERREGGSEEGLISLSLCLSLSLSLWDIASDCLVLFLSVGSVVVALFRFFCNCAVVAQLIAHARRGVGEKKRTQDGRGVEGACERSRAVGRR